MSDLAEANAMAINNDDRNQPPDDGERVTRRVGRPRKEKARRSFAKELHELQVRVINALYLLRRSQDNESPAVVKELVGTAIDMLSSE